MIFRLLGFIRDFIFDMFLILIVLLALWMLGAGIQMILSNVA